MLSSPPLLLLLLMMMMCCGSLSSSTPIESRCQVDCFPSHVCIMEEEKKSEDITIKCANDGPMLLDGSITYQKAQWKCNAKKSGNLWWKETGAVKAWRMIKTVECLETMSCFDVSPLVSNCRFSHSCKQLPVMNPHATVLVCPNKNDEAVISMMEPGTTKALQLANAELTCDSATGQWQGTIRDAGGKIKPIIVPKGSNVRCIKEGIVVEEKKVKSQEEIQREEDIESGKALRFWNLLGTLLLLVTSFFTGGYAYYIWSRYEQRHRRYLQEQKAQGPISVGPDEITARLRDSAAYDRAMASPKQALFPAEPITPAHVEAMKEEDLKEDPAHPGEIISDDDDTVPTNPEGSGPSGPAAPAAPDASAASGPQSGPKSGSGPSGSGPSGSAKSAGSGPSTAVGTGPAGAPGAAPPKDAKDKKKQKEHIGEEQYDTVVAMDKYFTKMDRFTQKIEDFSEDDLEESWQEKVDPAPEGGFSRVSKASKMSVKKGASRAQKARMLSRHMAESIKANEEMAPGPPRNKSSRRQPSGLLDSKAETSRGIF